MKEGKNERKKIFYLRNTVPSKEPTFMVKPKTLLPRTRASSSSVTQGQQQLSETQEMDYSSPKYESSPTKAAFVKPKMEKDEQQHSSSPVTSPHKLKKAQSSSISKKPTTQSSEDEQKKSEINLQVL